MFEFMDQILKAKIAPLLKHEDECWYLPLFCVYRPRKPDKIRVVFDSSIEFKGNSLNKPLLSGPDLNNSLLGVLPRFRQNQVAVVCDIQQMFYSFFVCKKHHNFLRFFLYENNDFRNKLIEYRMTFYVCGNTPSPAVTTF